MRLTGVPPDAVMSWLISEYVFARVGSPAVGKARTPAGREGLACAAKVYRLTVFTAPPTLQVKTPLAAVGVSHVPVSGNDCGRSKNSKDSKKNSLFFSTGPPIVNPYSLRLIRSFAAPCKQLKKAQASKYELRLVSYSPPWNELVPPLVTNLICTAPSPVLSALAAAVLMVISSIACVRGWTALKTESGLLLVALS